MIGLESYTLSIWEEKERASVETEIKRLSRDRLREFDEWYAIYRLVAAKNDLKAAEKAITNLNAQDPALATTLEQRKKDAEADLQRIIRERNEIRTQTNSTV